MADRASSKRWYIDSPLDTTAQSYCYDSPEKIISTHTLLAHMIAGEYKQRYPHADADDLVGVAMLGLVKAAKSETPTKDDTHAYKRIAVYIHGEIKDHLRRDNVIRLPQHAKAKPLSRIDNLSEPAARFQESADIEDILSIAETKLERDILEYRSLGCGDREIGEYLSVSATTVFNLRIDLWRRYCDRRRELG